MQIGTRWSVGDDAPDSLPGAVQDAVAVVEDDLASSSTVTDGWTWTLTFLEGTPVVELDDGTVIRYDPAGEVATVIDPVDTADVLDETED